MCVCVCVCVCELVRLSHISLLRCVCCCGWLAGFKNLMKSI
jgi:hypothetical protein